MKVFGVLGSEFEVKKLCTGAGPELFAEICESLIFNEDELRLNLVLSFEDLI